MTLFKKPKYFVGFAITYEDGSPATEFGRYVIHNIKLDDGDSIIRLEGLIRTGLEQNSRQIKNLRIISVTKL